MNWPWVFEHQRFTAVNLYDPAGKTCGEKNRAKFRITERVAIDLHNEAKSTAEGQEGE